MFTSSNWFAFQDERMGDNVPLSATSPSEQLDEINLNGTSKLAANSSDIDEVVIGEDELVDKKTSDNGTSISNANPFIEDNVINDTNLKIPYSKEISAPVDEDLFADRPMPEHVAWGEPESVSRSGLNPFIDYENIPSANASSSLVGPSPDSSQKADVVGVELEGGSEKAMYQAFKEGSVGEAGPLKNR